MRLPVVPQLSTKNGTANQNARLTNVLKETGKTGDKAVIRPALVSVLDYSGIGSGLIPFHNTLLSIYDDVIYADNAPPASSGDFTSPDVAFNLASIAWNSGTTYSQGNSVWYGGVLWFSLVNSNTNHAPAAGAYWVTSFPPAWNSGYTYGQMDTVWYSGAKWFSVNSGNIGNTPAAGSSYWASVWYMGDWTPTGSYDIGDSVEVNGITYYSAINSNTNNQPNLGTDSHKSYTWMITSPGPTRYSVDPGYAQGATREAAIAQYIRQAGIEGRLASGPDAYEHTHDLVSNGYLSDAQYQSTGLYAWRNLFQGVSISVI